MNRKASDRNLVESAGPLRRILPWILVAAFAVGAFLVSLAATLPARVVSEYVAAPIQIKDITGTIWNGGAGLEVGHSLSWHADILGSIASFGPVLDVKIDGPGTELTARVSVRDLSGGTFAVSGLNGRVAWPLVALVAPDLEIACDLSADPRDVAIEVALGRYGGSGGLTTGPGTCARIGEEAGEPVVVPPLVGKLSTTEEGLRGALATAADPDTWLAEILVANRDALVVTVYPEGAALVPGMPASGETSLEYPLAGLFP